jgi:hypothetical protein
LLALPSTPVHLFAILILITKNISLSKPTGMLKGDECGFNMAQPPSTVYTGNYMAQPPYTVYTGNYMAQPPSTLYTGNCMAQPPSTLYTGQLQGTTTIHCLHWLTAWHNHHPLFTLVTTQHNHHPLFTLVAAWQNPAKKCCIYLYHALLLANNSWMQELTYETLPNHNQIQEQMS